MIVSLLAKITNQIIASIILEIPILDSVLMIAPHYLKILLLEIVLPNVPQVIGAIREIILVTNNVLMVNMDIKVVHKEHVIRLLPFPALLLDYLVTPNQDNISAYAQLHLNFTMEIEHSNNV